jgi:hypothetical protein
MNREVTKVLLLLRIVEHFRHIWASTGGDWDANPWVWVVEFKRIEQERKAA